MRAAIVSGGVLVGLVACTPGGADEGRPDDTFGVSSGSSETSTSSSSTTGEPEETTGESESTDAGTETETSTDTGDDGTTTGEDGCDYELVHEQPGVVLEVSYDDSLVEVTPLPAGHSFACMRIEFDMQTAATLEQTLMDFPGCPIFTMIGGVRGSTPDGTVLASALFKYYKVGCTPGPDRIELDTFADALVVQGPWPIGELYHFEITVEPYVSRVRVFQGGRQVGPEIVASIEGATFDMARDPLINLGMAHPAGDPFFPNYGGTYSNLEIWAEVIAP